MKKIIHLILVISFLIGSLSLVSTKAIASNRSCGYEISFKDDFNGNSLDTTKWSTEYPSGNGGEQQFYSSDAITLQDGVLYITAEKRSSHGYPYTSGIITTQGKFTQQYGFFSIRVKLPNGKGFWPAFWMLPAQPAYPTEIDIFEMLGGEPNKIFMANHWKGMNQDHHQNIISYEGPDFTTDFHTFTLQWTPSLLIWYVDGVERYRTREGVPVAPMFLLVNFAVGGRWPGVPNTTTTFPSSMEIDYISVYQYQCKSSLVAVNNLWE